MHMCLLVTLYGCQHGLYNIDSVASCMSTWEMCRYFSATFPISSVATEQAGPRIISLVGCDGSVCWIR